MSNSPVDRNVKYMKEMWGTTKLITDYASMEEHDVYKAKKQIIDESLSYQSNHQLKRQTELHEIIRNDDDYDDWEYGTEPSYGKRP